MPKSDRSITTAETPDRRATVFICEKCGKRVGGSGHKNPSHRLASQFKRQSKHQFEKGDVRIVLTSCMDICPDDRIAITLLPCASGSAPSYLQAKIDDIEASSEELVKVVRRTLEN